MKAPRLTARAAGCFAGALVWASAATGQVTISSANPPTDNPFVPGVQPFRDVLQTGTTASATEGIGGAGTPAENTVQYAPLLVTFSAAPTPVPTVDNICIGCTGPTCVTVSGVTGSGAGPYAIGLSGPIPPGQCTTLIFTGTAPGQRVQYESLPGDVDMSGMASSSDVVRLVYAQEHGIAHPATSARFDINRDGLLDGNDVTRLIELLNGTNTTQPWAGATLGPCPASVPSVTLSVEPAVCVGGTATATLTADPPDGTCTWEIESEGTGQLTLTSAGCSATLTGTAASSAAGDVTITVAYSSSGVTVVKEKKVTVTSVDLDVDTNRDEDVDGDDETGEDAWTNCRGAIYNVNYDRDGSRTFATVLAGVGGIPPAVTIKIPDSIYIADDGKPTDKEYDAATNSNVAKRQIENDNDAVDIARLVIRKLVLPAGEGYALFLKAAEKEDIQSIHVYKSITAGQDSVWGSVGDRVPGGAAEPLEKDITAFISGTGDDTFGIEGLFFRHTGSVNPFDGEIDLTLELRKNGNFVCSDSVRLKVAPWMMISHKEESLELWAKDAGADNDEFRLSANADNGYYGLDASLQLEAFGPPDSGNQWFQDHIETGYYHRPGGVKVHCVFRLPYQAQPVWPVSKLLKPFVGVFQLKNSVGADQGSTTMASGSIGGNIEVMPPNAANKLGRIVVGDTRSDEISKFLTSQEVQSPIEVPTQWLAVGHVDEMISFTSNVDEVVVGDPKLAYTLMNAIAAGDQGKSVFFATGALPVDGPASANATANDRIETGINHTGQTWKYIRIYDSAASASNAAGQVGEIDTLGNGFITVKKVWNTTSKIIDGGGADIFTYMLTAQAPNKATWYNNPQAGDKYVLTEGTRFWTTGTPSIVTVKEVLADADLDTLNQTKADAKMTTAKTNLDNAAGGAGTLTFKKVPVIFVGKLLNFDTNRAGVAFTPGLANVQPILNPFNEELYFPRQFGPRNAAGKDIFEDNAKGTLPDALFVDDWDLYHRLEGEVHCGTNTKREFPGFDWWTNLP